MIYIMFIFTNPNGNVETIGMVPAPDNYGEEVYERIKAQMTENQLARGCEVKYSGSTEPNFICDIKKHAVVSFGKSLEACSHYSIPGKSLALTAPSGGDE